MHQPGYMKHMVRYMKQFFITLFIIGFYQLSQAQSISGLTHTESLTSGDLVVSWTAIPAGSPAVAYEYELEWTYISAVDAAGNKIVAENIYVPNLLFQNNSSRVVVKTTSFSIPLVYEQGYILYRLRGAWTDAGALLHTNWTNQELNEQVQLSKWQNGTSDNFFYLDNGLEKNKNWQSSISFAEEGKTKTVVSYHDGSMRNRQAVTRINSDQRAIIGETFYDFNGRASLQLLPVPVTTNFLTYKNNFNLGEITVNNITSTTKAKGLFELKDVTKVCDYPTPAFSTTTGASKYYSPNNHSPQNNADDFKDATSPADAVGNKILNMGLIPDAKKFPYTQTLYTPDNTGRVKLQTGVGEAYNFGSGHVTQNMYGKPQQEELSRLFGTEVGFADHYKKNVTVDANGQPSVSYLDLDGKVVATTLAGGKPASVDELISDKSRTINSELLTPQGNLLAADGLSKTFSSKVVVTAGNTQYDFAYKGTAVPYALECDKSLPDGSTGTQTFPGGLKLDLSLTDECGVKIIDVADKAIISTGPNSFNESKSVKLDKGEYLLTKKVSVDEDLLDAEWDTFVGDETKNCLKKITDFEAAYKGQISTSGCDVSCETCQQNLNTLVADGTVSAQEIALVKLLCDRLCGAIDPCDASFRMMAGDMAPGGQYGEIRRKLIDNPLSKSPTFNEANNALVTLGEKETMKFNFNADTKNEAGEKALADIDPTQFNLSVYNPQNFLPSISTPAVVPSWKKPKKIEKVGNNISFVDGHYYNLDGTEGTIPVFVAYKTDGTFDYSSPVLDANGLVELNSFPQEDGVYPIHVEYLNDVKDFIKVWKPSYGSSLVAYHPELPYYKDCIKYQEIYQFDVKLSSVVTWAGANNLYIKDGLPDFQVADPLMSSTDASLLKAKNELTYALNHYPLADPSTTKNMVNYATMMANCPRMMPGQVTTCGGDPCSTGLITNDEEWNIFKSLYMGARQKAMRVRINSAASNNFSYNGCIGHEDFKNHPESKEFFTPKLAVIQVDKCDTYCDFWGFSWGGKSRCIGSWKKNCYLAPQFIVSVPYQLAKSPCGVNDYRFYKDKEQRFFPTLSTNTVGGAIPENCIGGDITTGVIAVPCSSAVAEAITEGIKVGGRKKLEDCGLCPTAVDVENLLTQLFDQQLLIAPGGQNGISVTCKNAKVQLGGNLFEYFKNGNVYPQNGVIYSSALLDGNTHLRAKLNANAGGTPKEITIDLTYPASYTFNNLINMCCVDVQRADATGKTFRVKTSYKVPAIQTTPVVPAHIETIYLTGSITINLKADCDLGPSCMVLPTGQSVVHFLNQLAVIAKDADNTTITKPSILTSSGPIDLIKPEATGNTINLNPFYDDAFRSLIGQGDYNTPNYLSINDLINVVKPKWSYNAGIGNLFYKLGGSDKVITFDIKDLSGQAVTASILRFDNIKPFADPACNANPVGCTNNYLLADAVIATGTTLTAVPVKINVVGLPYLTACKALKPAVPADGY